MASHASLAEFFAPNDSVYSAGTAARIAFNADMLSSSLSVPLSMAFQSRQALSSRTMRTTTSCHGWAATAAPLLSPISKPSVIASG